MEKRENNNSRATSKSREKRFMLDCTNKSTSKYRQYNPLNDKYLKYIVPCPCNYYLIRKCANKK